MKVTGGCQAGQNCPGNAMEYPIVVPAGNPAPAPVTFYDPTANAGIFDVTAAINIAVPVNAYAGKYTSTITIANQSGP